MASLDDGNFGEKYKLKPVRHLKGRRFKNIENSDDEEDINEALEDIGVNDKNDRSFVIDKIKKIVKNGNSIFTLVCVRVEHNDSENLRENNLQAKKLRRKTKICLVMFGIDVL